MQFLEDVPGGASTQARGFYGRVPNCPGIFVRVDICPGNLFVRVDRCPGNFVPPDIMPSLQRGSPPFVLNELSKKIRRKGSHHDIVR